jgi:DNA modification methylase
VLDPFAGSGTTLLAARDLNRNYIGIEMNSDYCEIIKQKLNKDEYR